MSQLKSSILAWKVAIGVDYLQACITHQTMNIS